MSLELTRFDMIMHIKFGKLISFSLGKAYFWPIRQGKHFKAKNLIFDKCPESQHNASGGSMGLPETQKTLRNHSEVNRSGLERFRAK